MRSFNNLVRFSVFGNLICSFGLSLLYIDKMLIVFCQIIIDGKVIGRGNNGKP